MLKEGREREREDKDAVLGAKNSNLHKAKE